MEKVGFWEQSREEKQEEGRRMDRWPWLAQVTHPCAIDSLRGTGNAGGSGAAGSDGSPGPSITC